MDSLLTPGGRRADAGGEDDDIPVTPSTRALHDSQAGRVVDTKVGRVHHPRHVFLSIPMLHMVEDRRRAWRWGGFRRALAGRRVRRARQWRSTDI
jgi:hypothetical protein